MAQELTAAPVLSTPAEHLFEHVSDDAPRRDTGQVAHASETDLAEVYEIARTIRELQAAGRRRVALQFPDYMLQDAPAVAALLEQGLEPVSSDSAARTPNDQRPRVYILADTSYSACCVDEVAAEHVHADVVVHYGRSCLSPTSRLPVIHVFTKHRLDHGAVLDEFAKEFLAKDSQVILMADVTYQEHLQALSAALRDRGYTNILSTSVVHNPSGKLPNRTVIDADDNAVELDGPAGVDLGQYDVFHISSPPTSLLLALSSRVKSLRIFPTAAPNDSSSSHLSDAPSVAQFTRRLLGRRYAKLLTLSTAGIIGILVNTLSVSNYLSSLEAIKKQIAAAGKKSYTVVVGKLNPAKLANFAEMDGWVVVGCWESSLVEDDAAFYRPAITPYELEVALMKDEERVWGVSWWGGIETVKGIEETGEPSTEEPANGANSTDQPTEDTGDDSDEESAPPEFDLRTGKLVSRSRPMRTSNKQQKTTNNSSGEDGKPQSGAGHSGALAVRQKSEVATINGVMSPGAEFLRSQRTWTGLGSDFDVDERSTAVEEGRSGVARGYTVGSEADRT